MHSYLLDLLFTIPACPVLCGLKPTLGHLSCAVSNPVVPPVLCGLHHVVPTGITEASSSTSSFCTNYCGWHAHASIRSPTTRKTVDIKYAFVGNAGGWAGTAAGGNAGGDRYGQ
jgi:hypothetical protein